MSSVWLDPLRRALDTVEHSVTVFFRDDDVGWADDRLFPLLDLFADYGLPIDLAVIPQALTPSLAVRLQTHRENAPAGMGLHQHGFAHINHQTSGRKCEFGSEREASAQLADLERGRDQLKAIFSELLDPIFTPPWNRCTAETGRCLLELGFCTLSREASAAPLDLPGLQELPVSIDWFAQQKRVRLSRADFGVLCATNISTQRPVGIMFHHARMDQAEHDAANALLALLASHERVRCHLMRDL